MPAFLVPLHEFNPCHNPEGPGGGQFCSTAGGRSPSALPVPPAIGSGRLTAEAKVVATLVAKRLGFDPAKIRFTEDVYNFTLNGQQHSAGGSYDHATGDVIVYPSGIPTKIERAPMTLPEGYNYGISTSGGGQTEVRLYRGSTSDPANMFGVYHIDPAMGAYEYALEKLNQAAWRHSGGTVGFEHRPGKTVINDAVFASLLAHEIQHHRFAVVMDQYQKEKEAIRVHDNAAYDAAKGQHLTTSQMGAYEDIGGNLRPDFYHLFPTVAALDHGHGKKGGGVMNYPFQDRLKKEDGISEYSGLWWKASDDPDYSKRPRWIMQLVNETQAEVAAQLASKKYGRPIGEPKPAWRKFYYAINREYNWIRKGRPSRRAG